MSKFAIKGFISDEMAVWFDGEGWSDVEMDAHVFSSREDAIEHARFIDIDDPETSAVSLPEC